MQRPFHVASSHRILLEMSNRSGSQYLKEFLDFAREVAVAAGRITLEYFRKSLDIEWKSDNTPVTMADRKAERYIRRRIQSQYPDHAILGEEFQDKETKSVYRWIIDPVDGTQSFIRGVPLYAVLIALEFEGEPHVGVIHIPPLDETIGGATGLGCFYNDTPCRVGTTSDLSDAWIHVTDFADLHRYHPQFTDRLLTKARFCRTWGDAYGYLLVATGRADVMIDPIMEIWDIAPLKPIVTEAGGVFTDLNGIPNPLGSSALACNEKLHGDILSLL